MQAGKGRGGSARMAAGTLIIVSALVGGCGGKSEKMTGGHGADQQESVCRKFAAWYTTENDEVTCAFEREALSLRCVSTEFGVTTTTYATIDDAVGDNRPLGKITYSRRTLVMPEVTFTETVSYDAAGRPTSSRPTIEETPPVEKASHGSFGFEYTAWDAEKRPTQAYVTIVYEGPGRPPGGCAGQDETREYDDANRRYVVTRPDGGGPLCQGFVTTWTFDADGILLEEATERQGLAVERNIQTTLETGEICRD